MIGEAMREFHRAEKGNLPTTWQFPYPHPKILGLIFDPHQASTLSEVVADSPAWIAGFRSGDKVTRMQDQAIISMADVQWVLHYASNEGDTIQADVVRDGTTVSLKLGLVKNWRSQDDISWRASSWLLRRVGLGGLFVKPATDEERQAWQIPAGKMALVVQHVGAFAPHDRAKKAGLLKGDVLISYDGHDDLIRETDLLTYSVNSVAPGAEVKLRVRRDNATKEFVVATSL